MLDGKTGSQKRYRTTADRVATTAFHFFRDRRRNGVNRGSISDVDVEDEWCINENANASSRR